MNINGECVRTHPPERIEKERKNTMQPLLAWCHYRPSRSYYSPLRIFLLKMNTPYSMRHLTILWLSETNEMPVFFLPACVDSCILERYSLPWGPKI